MRVRTAQGLGHGDRERVDAVIVGGGASGLSLACHLAASGWYDRRVLIVDHEAHPLAGRAWAFWSAEPGLLDGAVSAEFDHLWFRTDDVDQRLHLDDYRYRSVGGEDLETNASEFLATAPGFRKVQGHVSHVSAATDHATVIIDGQAIRADWVFDSVGVGARHRPTDAALAFVGYHVRTQTDRFDPSAPVLMDFRTDQHADLAFVYVLPTSARSALVEHTRFVVHPRGSRRAAVRSRDPRTTQQAVAEAALHTYLVETLGAGGYQFVSAERGVIPLTTRPPRPRRGRVVPIGTPAGMIKASTGYGYARMQRHSRAITRSLARHGHPFDVPTPAARHRLLDGVLLEAIRREPAAVIRAFERMFTRHTGDRVLGFLDENTTLAQEIALILTMPPGPFLRALGRHLLT